LDVAKNTLKAAVKAHACKIANDYSLVMYFLLDPSLENVANLCKHTDEPTVLALLDEHYAKAKSDVLALQKLLGAKWAVPSQSLDDYKRIASQRYASLKKK
jgi:hypothetical protein